MATTAVDPVFVDTDVLVYANTVRSPLHIRAQFAPQDLSAICLCAPDVFAPVAPAALVADVVRFQTQFLIAEDGPLVTSNLLGLLSTYSFGGKQVHDANIIATMQVQAIRQILTNNVADLSRFGSLITVIPL